MRRISMSIFALMLFTAPVLAENGDVACRAYAQAVADDYAAGHIERAEEDSAPSAGQVLVIAAGKKYYVPRKTNGIIQSVGHLISERKDVYWEEYDRCLRGGDITINLGSAGDAAAN
jgi:3D (Asp-Asp-Asp) domain-containing protein